MFPFSPLKAPAELVYLLITTSLSYYIIESVPHASCAGRQNPLSQTANPQPNRTHLHADSNQKPVARNLIFGAAPPTTTTQPTPVEAPDFEEPIGNHTVALGRNAELSCKINNLGNFRTAWLRVEDKGILTIHNNIITRNYRIGLINNEDGRNFVLTIKNVQPSDKVSRHNRLETVG